MDRPLASVIRRAPHSRTCATLPGADSSSGRKTVWIESPTRPRGLTSSRLAWTTDRSVSVMSSRRSLTTPRRSARIFTCAAEHPVELADAGAHAVVVLHRNVLARPGAIRRGDAPALAARWARALLDEL